ncbi:MAG: type I-E CRISPR-associated protein Cse1/CasA, partial [Chloroflexi bacterium]
MSRQPPQFNLVDEPWIPCVMPDGTAHELSLRETLARAAEIRELSDPSPAVTVALHRLLLAVLHRSLQGPDSAEAWHAIWTGGAFDMQQVGGYLDAWRHRFDLFDAEHPFYQDHSLDIASAKPIARMVFGLTLGNYVTLFDHTTKVQSAALSPAQAARQLIAFHIFTLGGKVGLTGGDSASGGPLATAAVTVVNGDNLFQTLMLNLHQYL